MRATRGCAPCVSTASTCPLSLTARRPCAHTVLAVTAVGLNESKPLEPEQIFMSKFLLFSLLGAATASAWWALAQWGNIGGGMLWFLAIVFTAVWLLCMGSFALKEWE